MHNIVKFKVYFLNMKNKRYLIFLLLFVVLLFIFLGAIKFISTRYDENHNFKIVSLSRSIQNPSNFPQFPSRKLIWEKDFPIRWVLDSVNFTSINEIKKVLCWMDTLNNDKSQNQQYLASVLTDSLQNRINYNFKEYSPDSLNAILIWAVKMKNFSEIDIDNQMFFDVVSSYWINFVSNNLSKLSVDNSCVKYKFKFKCLVSHCSQNLNEPNVKVNNTEKVINYSIEGRWGYLWDRFAKGTSVIIKVVFFVFISVLFFSFYCLLLFIRKKL